MFKIENLMFHCYNNGVTESYSAKLQDNNESGSVLSAYNPSMDLIYHLTVNSTLQFSKGP